MKVSEKTPRVSKLYQKRPKRIGEQQRCQLYPLFSESLETVLKNHVKNIGRIGGPREKQKYPDKKIDEKIVVVVVVVVILLL